MEQNKYIIYTRKSSEAEDRQVLSLESQLNELNKTVKIKNLKIVDLIEESKSAKRPNIREGFSKMIKAIENRVANGILVWSPNRLSRNALDTGSLIQLMDDELLVSVTTPNQEFINEPMSKMMLTFLMMTAKLENDIKAEDVKRGIKTKLETGWFPFVAPQGYINSMNREKGTNIIMIDEKRYSMVRKMWDYILTGNYSVNQIVEIAETQWGYKSIKRKKTGNSPISRSGLYDIFTNPFYYGKFCVKGTWYKGKHKPMVTKDEFDKVQSILGRPDKPRPKRHYFPFTGMIKCADCGCSITATVKEKYFPNTNNHAQYTYYHCTKKRKEHNCRNKPINADSLEIQITDTLAKIEIHPDFKKWAITYLREIYNQEAITSNQVHYNLRTGETDIKEKLNKLLDLKLNDQINDSEYDQKKKTLQTALDKIEERLADSNCSQKSWIDAVEEAFDFASNAVERFKEGDLSTKKNILSGIGSNFLLKDKKVLFDLKKPYFVLKDASEGKYDKSNRLELVNVADITAKTGVSQPENPNWLRLLDSFINREIEFDFSVNKTLVETFKLG